MSRQGQANPGGWCCAAATQAWASHRPTCRASSSVSGRPTAPGSVTAKDRGWAWLSFATLSRRMGGRSELSPNRAMALNSRSNFLPRHRTDRDTGRGALQAIAAATGALVLLTSGCSTAPSRPTPRNGGTIYVALANDPPSLNPLADDDADSVRAYTPIF